MTLRVGTKLGDYTNEEAIARLKLARQLDPVSPRPHAAAAAVYYAAGEYRLSVDESRAALDLDPHLPTAHYFLGVSQFATGQDGEALESLQRRPVRVNATRRHSLRW